MKEFNFKLVLKGLSVVLVALLGIIASSGAMNYGYTAKEWIYFFAGILNFGIVAWADYSLYKLLFKKHKTVQSQQKS